MRVTGTGGEEPYPAAVLCAVGDLVDDVTVRLPRAAIVGGDTTCEVRRHRGGRPSSEPGP